ncbi:PGAP1-like protein-domain-containing protein [Choanephora cucurbitarum]|nr:PGAP1-like protein-domain-containing protein [Choanephora cucurbitarum]
MTRFAGKYGLYLYREKGIDYNQQPTGVPVLFIPGHAGSYKQVRSIAAESAFYYDQFHANDLDKWEQGVRNLDFFTVDFHEEFSALHGQSILEQAEYLNDAVDYILKLYPQARKYNLDMKLPDPTSVIIIGHSMGGIVARTMVTMSNYQHGTINTIITMSTPHMLPPVPFDWKISKLYDDINQFWQEGFLQHAPANDNDEHHHINTKSHQIASLHDISIVSMAGGTLDNTVCSDSTNIGSIVPPTNGFTVFSTAVPHVWTGADHVSILTCSQLVKVVSRTLLELVDVRRGSQTKPLQERMEILRQAFLSGLEDRRGDGSDLQLGNLTLFNLKPHEAIFMQPGERLHIGNQEPLAKIMLLPTVANANAFAVLSSSPMDLNGRFELFLCSHLGPTIKYVQLTCRSINSISVPIPASTKQDIYPFSGNTFSFASIEFDEMGSYTYIGIVDKGSSENEFLIAEPFRRDANHQVVHQSMLSIALEGVHVKSSPGLFTSIRIPSIESPILAYHLKVSRPNCQFYPSYFAPFLRQSISTMHESKFYVNLAGEGEAETEVSIHGRTAFASVVSASRVLDKNGLSFQVWMDPACPEPLQLDLSIDWYGSAGRLGFRNGIMLATFSFVIVMLVFVAQIKCYNDSGIYPDFGQGLSFCLRRSLPIVMICVGLCSIAQCTSASSLDDVWHHLPSTQIAWQDIMSGNTDPFFWWIPLAGLIMSLGIVSLLWLMVEGMIRSITLLLTFFLRQGTLSFWPISRAQETRYQQIQRRAITTFVLFVLVATFIPYQFVFVVAFLVQIVTCVRSFFRYKAYQANRVELRRLNRYNYMLSLLLLFFTLLPFNLPILLVWIRNISVHWFVPFSSDHSVLAIAPFMIYVEVLTSNRKMIPRQTNR